MDNPDFSLIGTQHYGPDVLGALDPATLRYAEERAKQSAVGGASSWILANADAGIGPEEAVASSVLQKKSEELNAKMNDLVAQRAKAIADMSQNLDDSEYQRLLGMIKEQMAGRQNMPQRPGPSKLTTAEQAFAALGAVLDPKHAAQNVASVIGGVRNRDEQIYQDSVADWQASEQNRNRNISDLSDMAQVENRRLDNSLNRETANIEANYSTQYKTLEGEKDILDKQIAAEHKTEVAKLTNALTDSTRYRLSDRLKAYNTLMAKYPDIAQYYSQPTETENDRMAGAKLRSQEYDNALAEMEIENRPTEIAAKNESQRLQNEGRKIQNNISKWKLKMQPNVAAKLNTEVLQKKWNYEHSEDLLAMRKAMVSARLYDASAWQDKASYNSFLTVQRNDLSRLKKDVEKKNDQYLNLVEAARQMREEYVSGQYSPETQKMAEADGYTSVKKWINEMIIGQGGKIKKEIEDMRNEIALIEKNVKKPKAVDAKQLGFSPFKIGSGFDLTIPEDWKQ